MNRSTEDQANSDRQAYDYTLWAKYEDVAMHFNDLIMRWRLQAIGGLAALVMFAGSVVSDVDVFELRYSGMILLSGTLLFAWIGIAVIDLWYYRRLLQGAVVELVALEKRVPMKLSSTIEQHAKSGATWGPRFFYALGMLPLVAILSYACWRLSSGQDSILQPSRTDARIDCLPRGHCAGAIDDQ